MIAPKARTFRAPQADEIDKIGQFVEIVGLGAKDPAAVARRLNFDKRQSSYYREAAEILGFLNVRKRYTLTDLGRQFLVSGSTNRTRLMYFALLRNPLIGTIASSLESRLVNSISKGDIAQMIKESSRLDNETVQRRAQTILAWMKWMAQHGEIIEVRGETAKRARQHRISEYLPKTTP